VRFLPQEFVELTERPAFILGLYRSGTTLLRRILDSHTRLACPSETEFMAHLFAMMEDDRSVEGLRSAGYGQDATRLQIRNFADQTLGNYALSRGKARWIDKTPRYIRHLEQLQQVYPDAQFIVIYRHPLGQIHSYTKGGRVAFWDLGPVPGDVALRSLRHGIGIKAPRNCGSLLESEGSSRSNSRMRI